MNTRIFLIDRKRALLSADIVTIKRYLQKYRMPTDKPDIVIMRAFQIALDDVTDITDKERNEAWGRYRSWLLEHGYKHGQEVWDD